MSARTVVEAWREIQGRREESPGRDWLGGNRAPVMISCLGERPSRRPIRREDCKRATNHAE
ncbi:hypothetical protein E2C01_099012 [Portunus trituberculatus]|uniref:Uncharacterized protein n=1 Tax=Portunus trituberculatus TaxID=210409 RepID=A0A5B7K9V7_PORTR|nr:hypothetical protein [Portunus trituberculatus]